MLVDPLHSTFCSACPTLSPAVPPAESSSGVAQKGNGSGRAAEGEEGERGPEPEDTQAKGPRAKGRIHEVQSGAACSGRLVRAEGGQRGLVSAPGSIPGATTPLAEQPASPPAAVRTMWARFIFKCFGLAATVWVLLNFSLSPIPLVIVQGERRPACQRAL